MCMYDLHTSPVYVIVSIVTVALRHIHPLPPSMNLRKPTRYIRACDALILASICFTSLSLSFCPSHRYAVIMDLQVSARVSGSSVFIFLVLPFSPPSPSWKTASNPNGNIGFKSLDFRRFVEITVTLRTRNVSFFLILYRFYLSLHLI